MIWSNSATLLLLGKPKRRDDPPEPKPDPAHYIIIGNHVSAGSSGVGFPPIFLPPR